MEARSGSIKTRAQYESILHLFFADPQKSPETYTRGDVDAFLKHGSFATRNAGQPVSVATRNGRLSALRSFYIFAASYEYERQALLPGATPVRGFRYLKPTQRYRAMNSDELARFFAAIPDTLAGARDRAFFMTTFWTARRLSEILRLCWRDIEVTTIMDNGAARHGYVYRFTQKGQSRQTKTVEMPAPAYAAIDTWLARSGRKATITPGEPIFSSVYLGRGRKHHNRVPLTHNQIAAQFQRYAAAAGLKDERHLTIHSLRHTAARLRYEAGSDIREIQTLLGHSSLMTTNLYLSTIVGISDPGAALLERKFAGLGAMG